MSVKDNAPNIRTVHAAFVKAAHLQQPLVSAEDPKDQKISAIEGPTGDAEMVSGKEIGAEGDNEIADQDPAPVDSLQMAAVNSIKETLNEREKQD